MIRFKPYLFLVMILTHISCAAFSASYFYELYIHNEYKAEPPGLPSKVLVAPIVSVFSGSRPHQWQENRLAAGAIAAMRLTHGHTWIELITALGKERVRLDQQGTISKESRIGMDDFLIDVGHNILDATGKKQVLIHWLTGIPLTNKITATQINQPLWGTRTYATGPVIEGVYEFVRNEQYDIFLGLITRYLHRFNRRSTLILPADALYRPGNQLDILALFHVRRDCHNIECGYVFSRFNQASYKFTDHVQKLLPEYYNSIYIDYFYYDKPHSRGYEINITKTYGTPYHGVTIFGTINWYF